MRPSENECVFWMFTDAFGSLRRFCRVVTCYNWASMRYGSVSPVCRYVLTIGSIKILYKCDQTSLTATHIAIRLTLECEVAFKEVKIILAVGSCSNQTFQEKITTSLFIFVLAIPEPLLHPRISVRVDKM